ncbi:MAG: hypothetical protein JWO92_1401 [Chitinophagaceae bacterium]|nr:hypothetical protein [Chitinophagaceae bacterium]
MNRSLFTCFILFFTPVCVFSQAKPTSYADSLKKIINKGLCNSDTKACIKQQIGYIKSCEKLGDYYTNLYLQKKIKENRTGLKYYLLAANLTDGTDSDLADNEVTYTLRNKVALKTGDLYFRGTGIPKDLNKALYYHHRGLMYSMTNKKESYYSHLYFHNTELIYEIKSLLADSLRVFAVNPFYMRRKLLIKNLNGLLNNCLEKLKSDTSIYCLIQANVPRMLGSQLYGQAWMSKFLNDLQVYFIDSNINSNRITLNIKFENEECLYKSYKLPCLNIKLSKEKLSEL